MDCWVETYQQYNFEILIALSRSVRLTCPGAKMTRSPRWYSIRLSKGILILLLLLDRLELASRLRNSWKGQEGSSSKAARKRHHCGSRDVVPSTV